jgi:hypothetical protein
MQRRTIIIAIAVAVIILLAIVIPLVMSRYYLTPLSEQRVIEQMRTTAAAATAMASTPTPLP